jgi:hypothetical protein
MLKPLDGYPAAAASSAKRQWAGDYFGPANYQQPGETVPVASLALMGFEYAIPAALSQSNNYYAKVIYPAASGVNETRAPTYANMTLQWYYAANNVQVANNSNLSAEVTRLVVVGI